MRDRFHALTANNESLTRRFLHDFAENVRFEPLDLPAKARCFPFEEPLAGGNCPMNIAITFRHMDATDSVKAYATEKIGRLQKFLRRPMTGQVTLDCQHHRHHIIEVSLQSGAEHFHAHETTEDMYASIDNVADKLERQIRHSKELLSKKGSERTSDRLMADTYASED
jgi:putative sigma-54 modulation protein